MHMRITESALDRLELGTGKQRVYWDTDLRGFGVVVGASISFVVNYRHHGALKRKVIGKRGEVRPEWPGAAKNAALNASIARRIAAQWLGAAKVGEDPAPVAEGPTLRDALEYHLGKMERGENRKGRKRSQRSIATMRGFVELHLRDYLDRPIVALDADAIDRVRDYIEANAERRGGSRADNVPGRASSNRLLQMVRTIWRSYHKRHGLPVPDPTLKLEPRAFNPARDERIANTELPAWHAKLWATYPKDEFVREDLRGQPRMSPVRRDLQLFSMFSSVRSDGVRNLRWEDVDYEDELVTITHAKGNRPYTIPMTATLREILERREEENAASPIFKRLGGDHGFVFPTVSRDGKRVIATAEPKERHNVRAEPLRRAKKRDGVEIEYGEDTTRRENYLPGTHANRRTYNSVAMEIGIPKEIRETLLNHEGRGVNVAHYGRPETGNYIRECAAKIEAALWERINGTGTPKRKRGTKRRAA